jgi:hypothetical protein
MPYAGCFSGLPTETLLHITEYVSLPSTYCRLRASCRDLAERIPPGFPISIDELRRELGTSWRSDDTGVVARRAAIRFHSDRLRLSDATELDDGTINFFRSTRFPVLVQEFLNLVLADRVVSPAGWLQLLQLAIQLDSRETIRLVRSRVPVESMTQNLFATSAIDYDHFGAMLEDDIASKTDWLLLAILKVGAENDHHEKVLDHIIHSGWLDIPTSIGSEVRSAVSHTSSSLLGKRIVREVISASLRRGESTDDWFNFARTQHSESILALFRESNISFDPNSLIVDLLREADEYDFFDYLLDYIFKECGADVNYSFSEVDDTTGESVCHSFLSYAVSLQLDRDMLLCFIKFPGADLNTSMARRVFRELILDLNDDLLQCMLENGRDSNIPDEDGWPTLYWYIRTVEYGWYGVIRAMIHGGANVNLRAGPKDQTPMMLNLEHELTMFETVEALLELGADPAIQDADGLDTYDYARNFHGNALGICRELYDLLGMQY